MAIVTATSLSSSSDLATLPSMELNGSLNETVPTKSKGLLFGDLAGAREQGSLFNLDPDLEEAVSLGSDPGMLFKSPDQVAGSTEDLVVKRSAFVDTINTRGEENGEWAKVRDLSTEECPQVSLGPAASDDLDMRNEPPWSCRNSKLFIGQIPRTMHEDDLRVVFQPFGPIQDLLVLRDKVTGIHKGCAFVTFCYKESAGKCQDALHGKKILPGMTRPLQVRTADAERRTGW